VTGLRWRPISCPPELPFRKSAPDKTAGSAQSASAYSGTRRRSRSDRTVVLRLAKAIEEGDTGAIRVGANRFESTASCLLTRKKQASRLTNVYLLFSISLPTCLFLPVSRHAICQRSVQCLRPASERLIGAALCARLDVNRHSRSWTDHGA
jgi:hypothetical protein